jgi:phosphatidylserine decarboxylase
MGSALITLIERLLVLVQHFLPQHLLSRMMYWLARVRWAPFKNLFIRVFVWLAGVDLSEATLPRPGDYPTFAAFFTRELRPGLRPLPEDRDAIASPVDGTISEIGRLDGDRVLQAKGLDYTAEALLTDAALAAQFNNGHFATVYLAPHQYHRVHMPATGTLRETRYVPGRLFSVAEYTVQRIPGLFTRNERLVCLFDSPLGPFASIMVGAMLVSSIETVWAGELQAPRGRKVVTQPHSGVELARGDEMGRFNMGSTVILLFPRDRIVWRDDLAAGHELLMGQPLGKVLI